jgi:thiol-disulfide isomerase/thioredoxin
MATSTGSGGAGSTRRGQWLLLGIIVATGALVRAQSKDVEYATTMQKGVQALAQGQNRAALDLFQKANALRDKKSPEAYFGIGKAYFGLRELESAVDGCTEGLKYSGVDKHVEASLHNLRGMSLIALGVQKNTQGEQKAAEADFRAALVLSDKVPLALYNLGVVLLRQDRDEEGIQQLQTFVARGGTAPEVDEARKMIADPRRARLTFAPDFSVPTLGGQRISLQDYRGKVVLLDFWGTWCGPCREFTPTLVEVNKRLAGQPFVTIGVACAEKSESAWRAYIDQNKMTWPQYLDTSRKVMTAFDVHEFPTYILIDHEGVIRDRKIGFGLDNASWMNDQVKKWVGAVKPPGGGWPELLPTRAISRDR